MITDSSGCHISNLPDELMLTIFRFLTWIPYRIKPIDLVFPVFEALEVRATRIEHEHMYLFKHSTLKLVCKSWYSLLVPVLYDWISLPYYKHLGHLRDNLCNPPMWGGHCEEKMGWYTKRLDLASRDNWPGSNQEEAVDALIDIIQALPNLEILTIRIHGPVGFWDYATHGRVFDAVTPKLRVFSCTDHRWKVEARTWHHFLVSHPNLTAINPPAIGPWKSPSTDLPCELLEHYCLSSVTDDYKAGTEWLGSCPSLQRLSILAWHSIYPVVIVQVSMQYASTLTTLQLNTDGLRWVPQLVQELELVFVSSPNLTRLDIIARFWLDEAEVSFRLPQSITVLGIRVLRILTLRGSTSLCNMEFLSGLVGWDSPKPTMIQYLDDFTMDCILAVSANRIAWGKVTSWLGPGGEFIDLKSVEDPEALVLQSKIRVMPILHTPMR